MQTAGAVELVGQLRDSWSACAFNAASARLKLDSRVRSCADSPCCESLPAGEPSIVHAKVRFWPSGSLDPDASQMTCPLFEGWHVSAAAGGWLTFLIETEVLRWVTGGGLTGSTSTAASIIRSVTFPVASTLSEKSGVPTTAFTRWSATCSWFGHAGPGQLLVDGGLRLPVLL